MFWHDSRCGKRRDHVPLQPVLSVFNPAHRCRYACSSSVCDGWACLLTNLCRGPWADILREGGKRREGCWVAPSWKVACSSAGAILSAVTRSLCSLYACVCKKVKRVSMRVMCTRCLKNLHHVSTKRLHGCSYAWRAQWKENIYIYMSKVISWDGHMT